MRGKIVLNNNSEIEFDGTKTTIIESDRGVTYRNEKYTEEVIQEIFYPWNAISKVEKYYNNEVHSGVVNSKQSSDW